MANYATNIFYASTENQNDLNKIEAFLDDNFSCYANKYGNSVDAEFPSRWEYPEKEMDQLVASLEAKDKVYIKILTYEFENEYVSFRIFSQGKWEIKISDYPFMHLLYSQLLVCQRVCLQNTVCLICK